MMNAQEFAVDEFKDKVVYAALAKTEKNPEFKKILEKLVQQEQAHFEFWKRLGTLKRYRVPYSLQRQFTQMLILSVGVAIVAFSIGSLAPHLLAF